MRHKLAAARWQLLDRSNDGRLLLAAAKPDGSYKHRHDTAFACDLQRNDLGQGRRSGLITSFLAVAALDFLFVPPRMSMAIEDLRYLPMFFIIVGTATSFLADLVRWQEESASQREIFVSALYSFSGNRMAAKKGEELLSCAARETAEAFECEVMILLPDETGRLKELAKIGEHLIYLMSANWIWPHGS